MGTMHASTWYRPPMTPIYEDPVTAPPVDTTKTINSVNFAYALDAAATEAANELIAAQPFTIKLLKNQAGYTILPGSVSFTWSGVRYVDRLGKLYMNVDPTTGYGVEAGSIDYSTGEVTLDVYDGGDNTVEIHSMSARIGNQLLTDATFRTPGAPLRPGSVSISGVALDGSPVTATSNFDGSFSGSLVGGIIDYEKGIIAARFGAWVVDDGSFDAEPWYHLDDVVDGQIFKPVPVFADSLTYACVVYSYIPLDADLIGLDPVRLPSDGRVPIVRTGDVVVVHNTQTEQLGDPLTAGQVITLNRGNIAHVELYDSSSPLPLRLPSTLFSWDLTTQELTLADPLDLSAYTGPFIAMHRIEDMALVSSVQINGQVIVGAGLANDYPVEGTYVSSALLYGDLQARAYGLFDQKTWTSVWSDDLIGDATNASYNEVNYPLVVTNSGGVNGKWCLKFTDTTHFEIIEEKLGIIGDGYTTQDTQPLNPATNEPYWFLDLQGWGDGWATGNVLRFNTDGPIGPLWIARTTLQGPVTEPNDQFTIQIRGDAE